MTDRELDRLIGSQQSPPLPADRLKQIEADLVRDLKPVRPLAPAGVYLAGFAAVFVGVCGIGCLMVGRLGWHALSDLQKLAIFAPLAAITTLLVFSVVRQMTPAAKHPRGAALLAAGLFVFLLATITWMFHPVHEFTFVRTGLACFRTGMLFAIPSAFLFALLLMRGAGLSPLLTGATAGGLAGLVGLTVLEIQCPNLNVYHIVVWHVSVTLVCVIGGLVFSGVTFRRRTSNT
jgi:hypothetical protein